MIQLKYSALFEIDFLHDYYTDKKCRDISIIPSPCCSELLNRLGLRFIATDTGCKIFAKVTSSGNKDFIKTMLPENTKFSFLMILQRPSFETFSAVKLSRTANEYYYFNNLDDNADGDILHLVNDTVSKKAGDNDLMRFQRNTYQFTHSSNAAKRKGEIRLSDVGEELTQELENNNNKFNFSFNLQPISAGRAGFFVNNTNADNFYIMEPASRTDIYGVVEIFHRSTLPVIHRFLNNDRSVATKKYKIAFASRQTIWRYVIKKQFNQQVTDVIIKKTNGAAIDFTKVLPVIPGQFILSSNNVLPMKEQATSGIRMTDQNNKEIIAHLPNPSLQLLKQENNQFFSDIFITI